MAITTEAMIAEYGAYYINSGQNMSRMRRLLLFEQETKKFCVPMVIEDTVYEMSESKMNSVVQSFQKGWTPKGDIEFTPNKIELQRLKIDIELYPDDIEGTWLGWLASNSLTRSEWPFIRYVMESHVYDQINDDMETNELYLGEYEKPTSGTAGLNGKSLNGIKKNLKKEDINHDTTIGSLEKSTIYDQFEAVFELVSEVYKKKDLMICCSPTWERSFLKDKRSLGFYTISGANQIDNSIDFTKAGVAGLPSMLGTNDWFITPKTNLLSITKKGQTANALKVEESKRCVNLLGDWREGIGFGMNQIVWTNVEAAV